MRASGARRLKIGKRADPLAAQRTRTSGYQLGGGASLLAAYGILLAPNRKMDAEFALQSPNQAWGLRRRRCIGRFESTQTEGALTRPRKKTPPTEGNPMRDPTQKQRRPHSAGYLGPPSRPSPSCREWEVWPAGFAVGGPSFRSACHAALGWWPCTYTYWGNAGPNSNLGRETDPSPANPGRTPRRFGSEAVSDRRLNRLFRVWFAWRVCFFVGLHRRFRLFFALSVLVWLGYGLPCGLSVAWCLVGLSL